MMALGDILAARADNARARGTVEAGTLGTVTVEALPVRELERLMRGADGDRAVFYAACRELQGAGAALLRAGAGEAADTGASFEASDGTAGEVAAHGTDTDKKAAFPAVTSDGRTADNGRSGDLRSEGAGGADENAGGQASREADGAEIRPAVVQVNAEVRREAVQKKTADAAFRPDTVREKAGKKAEIRHRSVHGEKAGGQASCEFLAEYGEPLPPDGKTQVLPEKSPDAPQNVGVSDKMDGSLQKTEREFLSERAAPEDGYALGLHESKSEIDGRGGANLHESESENGAGSGNALHEGESEITETLHETESENDATGGDPLHESKSEVTETLHETTSELAERVARELLDGLRRAAWVR